MKNFIEKLYMDFEQPVIFSTQFVSLVRPFTLPLKNTASLNLNNRRLSKYFLQKKAAPLLKSIYAFVQNYI